MKWFNSENATYLSFLQIETMFVRKLNNKLPNNTLNENSISL